MKHNAYAINIRHLNDKDGNEIHDRSFEFIAGSHDDIIQIIQRAQGSGLFARDSEAAAFATGLKLLGEIMLQYRSKPGFDALAGPFGVFMRTFKAMVQTRESGQDG